MNQLVYYRKFAIIALLALGLAGLVMACAPASATPVPRSTPEDVEVAVVPPPTPGTQNTPTPPPAILAPDDGCVTCHSSQETLIETAKEEEVVEHLSEGEG